MQGESEPNGTGLTISCSMRPQGPDRCLVGIIVTARPGQVKVGPRTRLAVNVKATLLDKREETLEGLPSDIHPMVAGMWNWNRKFEIEAGATDMFLEVMAMNEGREPVAIGGISLTTRDIFTQRTDESKTYEFIILVVAVPFNANPTVLSGLQQSLKYNIVPPKPPVRKPTDLDVVYESLLLTSDDSLDKAKQLQLLGDRFLAQYKSQHSNESLNKAISIFEDVARLTEDGDPEQASRLHVLGFSLHQRYELLSKLEDLEQAVFVYQAAADLTPEDDSNRGNRLSNLGGALRGLFEVKGDSTALDRSIEALQAAVQLEASSTEYQSQRLSNLGNAYYDRYELTGENESLSLAVQTHEMAVALVPDDDPAKAGRLNNLAVTIKKRYAVLGQLEDINWAISNLQIAVAMTPETDKYFYPMILSNLGEAFYSRYSRHADHGDLARALDAQEKAVRMTPVGHSERPGRLTNYGTSLRSEFKFHTDLSVLEKAIEVLEEAVALINDENTSKPNCLNNLGTALMARHLYLQEKRDMERAVWAVREAVRLTPQSHAMLPARLNQLSTALLARFGSFKKIEDLSEAIGNLERVVELSSPDNPSLVTWLGNLASAYAIRGNHFQDIQDSTRAISNIQHAISLVSGDPYESARTNNLGKAYSSRYRLSGDLVDLDKAIECFHKAIALNSQRSEDPLYLGSLASSYLNHHSRTGDDTSLDNAISFYAKGAKLATGMPLLRFYCAREWADITQQTGRPALEAFSVAVALVPRVAWVGMSMRDRHQKISAIGNVVRRAASEAVNQGEYELALEWLENGRTIVWGQLLQLRSPVEDMRSKDPQLADRMLVVSRELQAASWQEADDMENSLPTLPQISPSGVNPHQLALEWDDLVEKARQVPGFESFLQPKKVSQLANAAQLGNVVVINLYQEHCDALVLMAGMDDILHIPLRDFTQHKAEDLLKWLDTVQFDAGVRDSQSSQARHAKRVGKKHFDPDYLLKKILAELWTCVVRPILDALALSVSVESEPPRIWWCPTGPLAFLPIHAAGLYDAVGSGNIISEYVVSSYSPTITALLDTRASQVSAPFKLLAVTQASNPNAAPLPNTTKELDVIRQRVGTLPLQTLEDDDATVEAVLSGMSRCSWAHLACHGQQDAENPTKSAVLLSGGNLELATIIRAWMPAAEFAFLSACQTATGDENLEDEAVHLAAGMLLAGYRSVIATMWSIRDSDAPLVADEVYAEMLKGGNPDSSRRRLHFIVLSRSCESTMAANHLSHGFRLFM